MLVTIGLCLAANRACASNGGVFIVPGFSTAGIAPKNGLPIYSKQSGLRVTVDTTWTGDRGYRPVKVTVSAPKAVTADTQITINFYASGYRYNQRAISVEQDFELRQGSTSTTVTLSVPQYLDWNFCGWKVWVDGVEDEELCLPWAGFNGGNNNSLAVGVLILDKKMPLSNLISQISGFTLETHALQHFDLPERWIDYTAFDMLATTVRDLQLAQSNSPERFAELRRWVRAGGNLYVFQVGQDFSELPALESVLEPVTKDLPAQAEPSATPLGHWRFLKMADSPKRIDALVQLTMDADVNPKPLSAVGIRESFDPSRAVDSRQWFTARAYGLGTVVAFQHTLMDRPADQEEIETVLQKSTLSENLHWANRHGNDPGSGNSSFNNWLIPDVGTAPVFEFQLLISLFVIGIGPVNYWILKRRDQLPLLLITVPLAALVATGLLFSYGFLADGIGVRVRVRSMTLLDQRSGEAASWARLSYYAGMAPADGLTMPTDSAFYPILPARSRSHGFGRQYVNQQRAIEWDNQQHLTRGWLASRTPTQYLAITARPTTNRLVFDSSQKPLTVTNQLGTSVLALVVQDHDGNIFLGEALEPGGSVELTPGTYSKGVMKIRTFLTENLPELPAGYVDNRRSNRGDYNVGTKESLMENQFQAIISPLAKGWGNGSYVAVTATGIEVPLGLEEVTESKSFHVVRGTW